MTRISSRSAGNVLVWGGYAFALLVAPLLFSQGAGLSILSQMGTAMVFALSYNMLLGQGGMLSFGHAVYSGLGAYTAIHALNLAADGSLPLPVALVPLAGGVGGVAFGLVFAYISTRKSGTGFAMITLGMVELVFASALMFPGFFGGEGGISGNRVIGAPFFGISFGPQIEVYYLIAAWLFCCSAAMYGFTRTPLGRILNAVRDNPQRAEFIGYDPRHVRFLTLVLSAFFAGVSGGLAALNFEIVGAENIGVARSAGVLLFCFIGGIGHFFGPLLGAVAGVFLTVVLSTYTGAWQFYLGAVFILMVMCAPGGLAGIASRLLELLQAVCREGFAASAGLLGLWAALAAAALAILAGTVMLIEMLYRRSLAAADGSTVNLFGVLLDAARPAWWIFGTILLAAGAVAFMRLLPGFRRHCDALGLGSGGGA
ncbi:branched-chain amino acid ABC transporter permease [Janthinobacterium sp. 17J80-10]|uniref:branched-chain amino acid ABC transporter permease n=1 Tax=Janthinobacterium sp. 17J80-10 TaxID=2497863 RepID=UPI001F509678|nr:branched-chain amino acid ABC transporter permease [Janthinobacterium sp. 17J80-10]